jgi:phosphate starvation-inducible PhoH-like protein
VQRVTIATDAAERLFGTKDENLRYLEDRLGVQVSARGAEVVVNGPDDGARVAAKVLHDLDRLLEAGGGVGREEFRTGVRVVEEDGSADLVDFFLDAAIPSGLRRYIAPRNLNQRRFMRAVAAHDAVFAIGPAGTGKTYLAVAMASAALMEKEVRRIVLVRPAVEAGERLGFLPGDLIEKINPYLRPVYDALYDILGYDKVTKFIERQAIEIAPLAFMRGRTLNDAFIILDEGQNTTHEQMKMFLTRTGFQSKVVVTGDITQIDLPRGQRSGLVEALQILEGAPGFGFIHFNHRDVVRHRLVQEVVDRYARWEQARRSTVGEGS